MENLNPKSLLLLKTKQMPYGKHRGKLLLDLPEPYVVWLYENQLPEGELGNLIRELYEIKVNGLESIVRKISFASLQP